MTWSPAFAISSTQISFESAVPWVKGWPEAERPDDDLDEVRLARLEGRDLGPQRAEEVAVDPAPFQAEEVDADLLVLEELRVGLDHLLVAADGRQAGVGRRGRGGRGSRRPLAVEVRAPKSRDGFSGMWQSTHFSFACGG